MAVQKSTKGHGGYRKGAGRKPKTDQNDAYTILAKAKASKETYGAKLAELEYKKAIGELVKADVVLAEWQEAFLNVRSKLLSIPSQLASVCAHLPSDEIEKNASELIRAALEELSKIGSN